MEQMKSFATEEFARNYTRANLKMIRDRVLKQVACAEVFKAEKMEVQTHVIFACVRLKDSKGCC